MNEFYISVRPWSNGQGASVSFSDNTPCMLADKIERIIKDFLRKAHYEN